MAKTPDYFHGKTIIITGAASGIGRATALIFAREGANVVCADIDEKGVEQTAEMINTDRRADAGADHRRDQARGGRGHDAAGDRRLRPRAFPVQFGGLGAQAPSKFLDIDDDLLERTFDLNFKGTFYAMQAILPHMLENKSGVIVNVASHGGARGGPGTSVHYAAAKGAVNTMTMGVAREFATQGIRCLSISPGPIDTNFAAAAATSPETQAGDAQRRADEALRQGRGDRRAGAVHVLGCLRVHDRGHGLCKRRRRLAVIRVGCANKRV